ncbi:HIT family protein [Synechococcus sp. A15-44]|jgi:diadenosine tetraphosphate (Ap4A) HIT family hydrolase|uniref:HIT family protein n=1 Tax=Synechococcus sp. A15-44 TaxID=1050646 RepID=UPI0016479D8E|nr:diadenosine tetraphosphate hydrolase [Synechococcus sp. A15-44]
MPVETCAICQLHGDPAARERFEIERSELWVLRHHPDPAPLPGWILLDSRRHCSGPVDFSEAEASDWGRAVRDASDLVKQITGCDRVYAIAFGEGAQHLHLHLIPRHLDDPASKAWAVADLYRAMDSGDRAAADPSVVASLVDRCRSWISAQG